MCRGGGGEGYGRRKKSSEEDEEKGKRGRKEEFKRREKGKRVVWRYGGICMSEDLSLCTPGTAFPGGV